MTRVALVRTMESDQGTVGRFILGGYTWPSLELPWRDNQHYVSRIPPGIYRCSYSYSPKFKRMLYLVEGVEGRSGIRIHPANWGGDVTKGYYSQLLGCIAPGLTYKPMTPGDRDGKNYGTQWAVTSSREALRQMVARLAVHNSNLLKGQPFELAISEAISDIFKNGPSSP